MRKVKVQLLKTQTKTTVCVNLENLTEIEFDHLVDVLMPEGYQFRTGNLCITLPNDKVESEIRWLKEFLKPYFEVETISF